MMHRTFATVLVAASLLAATHSAQDWSRFRGPNGTGVSSVEGLPTTFGPEENVTWKVEVPFGTSSPVLTRSSVVLSGADGENLIVVAFDRETGKPLWERTFDRTSSQEVYKDSDSASPTPVTDGENVHVFFPELGLVSLDAAGAVRWTLPLGPFVSFYGMSASPILAGDTIVLVCDQQQGSFMIGVDGETGKPRWRTERKGIIESWATPVLYEGASAPQIVCFGTYFVCGYSVDTGEELWRMKGVGYTPVTSPVLAGDVLYVSVPNHAEQPMPDFDTLLAQHDANEDGRLTPDELAQSMMQDHFGWVDVDKDDAIVAEEWDAANGGMSSKDYGLVAIDLSGLAEGKEAAVLWRYKKNLPPIASPILVDGVIYLVKDGGVVTSVDAATGEELKRERIPDGTSEYYPSPIAADGKIYVTGNMGQVAVLAAGTDWEVLGVNQLGEDCSATPAIGADGLYIRTHSALFRFGRLED